MPSATSEALQIFGGNGLTREYPMEKLLRDTRACLIADGCNEILSLKGGTLLIGVDDAGKLVGLELDYESLRKKDRDGFELHLRQLLVSGLGESVAPFITVTFHESSFTSHTQSAISCMGGDSSEAGSTRGGMCTAPTFKR